MSDLGGPLLELVLLIPVGSNIKSQALIWFLWCEEFDCRGCSFDVVE